MPTSLRKTGLVLSLMACLPFVLPTAALAVEPAARGSGGFATRGSGMRGSGSGVLAPLPSTVPASLSAKAIPAPKDVALGVLGELRGQLLDAQGRVRANEFVMVQRPGQAPIRVQTDDQGRFVVAGLSGGAYQVFAKESAITCRCWTAQTAPPVARQELLVVTGEGVQRAQRPFGDLLFSTPVLVGLVIAAAVAIPIAVHNSQDDAS